MDDNNNKPSGPKTEEFLARQQQALLQDTTNWLNTRGRDLATLLDTIIDETDDPERPGPGQT